MTSTSVVEGQWGVRYGCQTLDRTDYWLREIQDMIAKLQQFGVPLDSNRNLLLELRDLYAEADLLLDRRLELAAAPPRKHTRKT